MARVSLAVILVYIKSKFLVLYVALVLVSSRLCLLSFGIEGGFSNGFQWTNRLSFGLEGGFGDGFRMAGFFVAVLRRGRDGNEGQKSEGEETIHLCGINSR